MSRKHSACSNGCTVLKNMRALEWDSRSSNGLFHDMAEKSGPRRKWTRARPFILRYRETRTMALRAIDILLIEDNASDAELTVHAFQKYSRAKRIHIVRDGAEALEFFHCTGAYA